MAWVVYSFIAAIGFGIISLLLTYLSRQNMSSLVVNTWFWVTTALIFLITSLATSAKQLKIHATTLKWFILLALIAVATNYFSVKALRSGPNTGMVRSIQLAQIIIATLGGVYLFHDSITARAGIGIALVVVGLILVVNK